jgi:hypothetical protein
MWKQNPLALFFCIELVILLGGMGWRYLNTKESQASTVALLADLPLPADAQDIRMQPGGETPTRSYVTALRAEAIWSLYDHYFKARGWIACDMGCFTSFGGCQSEVRGWRASAPGAGPLIDVIVRREGGLLRVSLESTPPPDTEKGFYVIDRAIDC